MTKVMSDTPIITKTSMRNRLPIMSARRMIIEHSLAGSADGDSAAHVALFTNCLTTAIYLVTGWLVNEIYREGRR